MRIVLVSVLIVLADQATKLAVKGFNFPLFGLRVEGVPYGASYPVIGDFLRLTYIENPGMAFGIDIGGKLFFSLFSVAASAGILYYLYRAGRSRSCSASARDDSRRGDRQPHRPRVLRVLGESELFHGRSWISSTWTF